MKSNINMQSNNVKHREKTTSAVLFDVRALILTLVITMTMVMGTAFFANTAQAVSGSGATVRVATFDQLNDALGNGGVSDIIIDPQAAEEFADEEGAEISFDGSDVFYIPIEYPLVVSHDVTISSEVAVNFARSGNGGSGKYDSRAFRGQNEVTPALFNVDQGKTLELSGDIAMTGEEVSATFDSAEGSFLFTVKARDNLGDDEDGNEAWSYGSDPGKLSTGGYFIYTKGGNVVMNDGILLMGLNTKDNVKDIAPVYIDGTAKAATLTVDGAEIVDNNLGQTEDGKSTAGAVILKGSNATAALNSGEISNNNADVAGIIVKEEAELELGNDFGINDSDIYDEKAEEDAKEETAEEEAAEEETKEETKEETPVVAPKKSLKSMKSPATQMRSTGDVTPTNENTARVATYDQLKTAINNKAIRFVVIDKTIAGSTVNIEVNGESSNKFYLPIDAPIVIDRPINISASADVTIARSDKFAPKNEAIFKVAEGGELTLGEKVTMSGDQVAYNYTFPAVTFGTGSLSLGGNTFSMKISTTEVLNFKLENGLLIDTKTGMYIGAYNNNIALRANLLNYANAEACPDEVELRDAVTGEHITSLAPGQKFVLYETKTGRYYKANANNYIVQASGLNDALQFTASTNGVTGNTSTKMEFTVENPKWSQANAPSGTEDNPKAFFVQVESGGTFNLSGAKLTDYNTVNTYDKDETDPSKKSPVWNAPVVVKGTFKMTSGSIDNNDVGYIPGDDESASNGASITDLKSNVITNANMTNTAGGVFFKGSSCDGKLIGGQINKNRADAGGIIVTDNANVTMENGFGINDNIGYHHAGAAQVERGGKLIMNGGTMSGNVAWVKGGAVWSTQFGTAGYADVDWSKWPKQFPELKTTPGDDGIFIMNGGDLDNNTAFARGGAIEVESNGVILNGGKITQNKCRSLGGAIYVEGDAAEYSYTLKLNAAYIGENTSVTHKRGNSTGTTVETANYTLNRYLSDGVLTNDGDDSFDSDFSGAMGNGGGVWLCPVGGTSVFAEGDVIIDNNTALRSGQDFYLHRGNGAMLVQNLEGYWKNESTNKIVNYDEDRGTVLNGPIAFTNIGQNEQGTDPYSNPYTNGGGVTITGNLSRDGGGIACNGTLLFGNTNDVDRFDARLNITKEWKGIDNKPPITFQIGYITSENGKDVFHSLNSATSSLVNGGSESQSYDFEMNGEADDLEAGAAIGELAPENGKWRASAFIPSSVVLSDGNQYPLFKFTNPNNTSVKWNPAVQADITKIREHLQGGGTLKVTDFKLAVKEVDANFKVTIKPITINSELTTVKFNTVPVYNAATGNQEGNFTVYFTTVELEEEIVNELSGIEFTKVSTLNNEQALRGAEFYIAEAERGTRKYYVPGTRDDDDGASLANCTIDKVALNDNPLKSDQYGKVRISSSDLKEGKSIQSGKEYLLFETKAPTGYERKKTPWLVKIDQNGNVKIIEVNEDYQGKAVDANDREIPFGTVVDGSDTESIYANRFMFSWYDDTNGIDTGLRLGNDLPKIDLLKVSGTSYYSSNGNFEVTVDESKPVSGAKFRLYTTTENPQGVWNRGTEVEPKEELITDGDGKISLPSTVTNTAGSEVVYWLEETVAAPGYKKSTSPWLFWVTNGSITHLRYADPNKFNGSVVNRDEWKQERDFSKMRLHNEPITLVKTNADGTETLGGATFQMYEAKAVDDNGSKYLYSQEGGILKKNNEIVTTTSAEETGIVDLSEMLQLATASNTYGKNATLAENIPELAGKRVMFLYEHTAPEGYDVATAPWVIIMDDTTNEVQILEPNNRYASPAATENNGKTQYWSVESFLKAGGAYNTINDGKLKNDEQPGQEIYKIDAATYPRYKSGDTIPQGKKVGDYKRYADLTDAEKTAIKTLPGARFQIIEVTEQTPVYESDGKTVKHYVYKKENFKYNLDPDNTETDGKLFVESDQDGKIQLPNSLNPKTVNGIRYFLMVEVDAPANYLQKTTPYAFAIKNKGISTGSGTVKVQYEIETYDAPSPEVLSEGQTWEDVNEWLCTTFGNRIMPYNAVTDDYKPLELTKAKGIWNKSTNSLDRYSDTLIDGATFEVYEVTDNDTHFNRGSSVGTATSENGTIRLPRAVTVSTGDKWFWIKETSAPVGYEKSSKPWLIQIKTNSNSERYVHVVRMADYRKQEWLDDVTETTWKKASCMTIYEYGKSDKDIDPTLYNEPIKVYKTDDYGHQFLSGAVFKVAQITNIGSGNNRWYRTYGANWGTVTSNADGSIDISDIVKDHIGSSSSISFMLYEDAAPTGFKKATTPWLVTVQRNGTVKIYEHKNRKSYPDKDDDGDSLTTSQLDWKASNYTTERDTIWNEFKNFAKVDSITGLGLKGAKFQLYKFTWVDKDVFSGSQDLSKMKVNLQTDKIGSPFSSKDDGTISFSDSGYNLGRNGRYLLFEISPSSSEYATAKVPWYVTTDDYGTISIWYNAEPEKYNYGDTVFWYKDYCNYDTTKLENSKVYELPNAGGMGTYWFMIIGAMMMGFALTAGFTKMDLLKLFRR